MLEFWIISVILTFVSNFIMDKMLYNKIENTGYIVKPKKTKKSKVIVNMITYFIPYLNLAKTLLNSIVLSIALKKEELFDKSTEEIKYKPESVLFDYKRNYMSKEQLNENLILDGADEETKKEEFKKFNNYKKYLIENKNNFFSFLEDSPYFEESDYNKAQAQIFANQFLFEIECNKELNENEKIKYLKKIKKVFLDDLNNKEKEKPITKVLK